MCLFRGVTEHCIFRQRGEVSDTRQRLSRVSRKRGHLGEIHPKCGSFAYLSVRCCWPVGERLLPELAKMLKALRSQAATAKATHVCSRFRSRSRLRVDCAHSTQCGDHIVVQLGPHGDPARNRTTLSRGGSVCDPAICSLAADAQTLAPNRVGSCGSDLTADASIASCTATRA